MTAPWPRSTCGQPGIRNLGTKGYCASHLAQTYRRFDPAVWTPFGFSVPVTDDLVECLDCGGVVAGPRVAVQPDRHRCGGRLRHLRVTRYRCVDP